MLAVSLLFCSALALALLVDEPWKVSVLLAW
jgi:hypothetical protein